MRRSLVLVCLICAAAFAQEPPPAPTLTLSDLLLRIDAADPAVRASRAAIAQAQRELAAARAFPRTEVEMRAGRASNETGSRTEAALSMRQPLDLFNRRGAKREAAEAQVAIEQASADATRLVVRGLVRGAYLEVLATDRALASAREDRGAARQIEQLVNRRAELGETREVDRLRIQIERQRAEDRVEQLEIARTAGERTLRLLVVGPPLPDQLVLADVPPVTPRPYEILLAQVIERQPRMQVAAAQVRQREALLALARANRLPDPSVGAYRSSEIDKRAGGVVLGFSIPVSGWNRGEIAAAQAALERAHAERDATQRQIAIDFTAAFHDREAVARRVARLQAELLPRATRALAIANFAYRQGETSQLDYLDARRTYVALQQELLDEIRQFGTAESRLEQLTGEPLDAQPHP